MIRLSVREDHDTSEFAFESIRRWWEHIAKVCYPQATVFLITGMEVAVMLAAICYGK
jgi:ABC-type nitrate/sulfonate/bicarbonate transport system permease component